ncbi:unnamed protein product [Ilex paraguariensis]|uniref:Uncharacterized protein n=1 Tax=Ilex paraguariensis TaxID=185542 RepID=A0ABC8RKY9_9AQUA
MQMHFYLIAESRALKVHPPAMPIPTVSRPKSPSIGGGFTINRYKNIEADAFRPTTPGHSPGVGHYDPPGAP